MPDECNKIMFSFLTIINKFYQLVQFIQFIIGYVVLHVCGWSQCSFINLLNKQQQQTILLPCMSLHDLYLVQLYVWKYSLQQQVNIVFVGQSYNKILQKCINRLLNTMQFICGATAIKHNVTIICYEYQTIPQNISEDVSNFLTTSNIFVAFMNYKFRVFHLFSKKFDVFVASGQVDLYILLMKIMNKQSQQTQDSVVDSLYLAKLLFIVPIIASIYADLYMFCVLNVCMYFCLLNNHHKCLKVFVMLISMHILITSEWMHNVFYFTTVLSTTVSNATVIDVKIDKHKKAKYIHQQNLLKTLQYIIFALITLNYCFNQSTNNNQLWN
jgi:hypothetical protein